jgi:hypothetical protein
MHNRIKGRHGDALRMCARAQRTLAMQPLYLRYLTQGDESLVLIAARCILRVLQASNLHETVLHVSDNVFTPLLAASLLKPHVGGRALQMSASGESLLLSSTMMNIIAEKWFEKKTKKKPCPFDCERRFHFVALSPHRSQQRTTKHPIHERLHVHTSSKQKRLDGAALQRFSSKVKWGDRQAHHGCRLMPPAQ